MRLVACTAFAAFVLGACGHADRPPLAAAPPDPLAGLARTHTGHGAKAVTIFLPARAPRRPPLVIFLHGWGAVDPHAYAGWIGHLVRAGNAVAYPAYQRGVLSPPPRAIVDLLAGVRGALRKQPVEPGSLVVAGHSAGGALAADYAALATSQHLPVPRAIFAAYPGRRPPRIPFNLPAVDPALISPGTRIVALAGARDRDVGDLTARAIVRAATRVPGGRRAFRLVRDPAADDHLGPQRDGVASRRAFWAPLDRLIREARR